MYESQYYMLDSYTNVDGQPTILRMETGSSKLQIPHFLRLVREVTADENYTTKNMAMRDF